MRGSKRRRGAGPRERTRAGGSRAGTTAALAWLVLLSACATPPQEDAPGSRPTPASDPSPRIRVLGSAQDGGLPHAACSCSRCTSPALRRRIASLGIVFPSSGQVFLVDATPDVREQLDALGDVRDAPAGRTDRAPVDGVFLTHAHIGHYLGLAFFGFEAVHTRDLPVYCTPRMARFLEANGPWSQLVRLENVRLHEMVPGQEVNLREGVSVRAVAVPHRDEFSDTVGFRIGGPRSTVLYVPDTDAWRAWDPPLETVLEGVDIAILDGTFYSLDELPGREVTSIGHPLIIDTMDRLGPARPGRAEVFFTHFNHSNPALDPGGAARREMAARGYHLLEDGQEFPL